MPMQRDRPNRSIAAATLAGVLLTGACTTTAQLPGAAPTAQERTDVQELLEALPPPPQPVVAAVYGFADRTGQHKPNSNFPEYSRAVTQGGASVLIKALQEAGAGRWFTVVERANLQNLLQERQLIRANREAYAGPDGRKLPPLPPLLNAGVLLEGGIISYDSNTVTGGAGARYLGIGGSTQYRQDAVTVYLRAVSTATGEVLKSVTARKSIVSVGVSGGAYRFVEVDELLEIEAGITQNEPRHIAVRKAIEKSVHALIIEGAAAGLWNFADAEAGAAAIAAYRREIERPPPAKEEDG